MGARCYYIHVGVESMARRDLIAVDENAREAYAVHSLMALIHFDFG